MIDTEKQDGRSTRALKKKELRKQEILNAAQKIICTKGYQFTNISDIIEEAGISRGTFYLYFQSLESVFHELVDDLIQKIMKCVQSVRIEDGRPMQDLQSNIERIVSVLFENRDLTAILLKEAIAVDKKVDEKLNTLYSFLYRMVRSALRNGVKMGFLREIDENIIAMAFIGSIKETLYQSLVVQKDNIDRKKITEELLKFGLLGLKK
jgi:AcrR family transcriptional regulator